MENWVKISREEISKVGQVVGFKKNELQTALIKALVEQDKLKQKLEEQTKTYQKTLQEQQNEIDQLERNCDVFNEQMNDAVERATELQQEKEDLIKWLDIKIKHISWFDNSGYTRGEYNTLKELLEKLGE